MKMRLNWLFIPALAVGLGSCDNKEKVTTAEAPAPVVGTPALPAAPAAPAAPMKEAPPVALPAPAPAVKALRLSPEERAAKLGFVKHLPQDTEVVLSFQNTTKTANRIKGTKLWKLVEAQMGGGVEMAPDEEKEKDAKDAAAPPNEGKGRDLAKAGEPLAPDANDPDAKDPDAKDPDAAAAPMGPAALFGSEFTLALGKSTAEQTVNLLTLNRRMGYFQMRALAKAFAAAAKAGDLSTLGESFSSGYGPELMKEVLKDPQSGIPLIEKAKMPPIYLAFKAKEADREGAAHEVAAMIANINMLGEMVEPISVENNGHKFEGTKILGAKISATMAANREEMDNKLDAPTVDKLLAAVAKKDLVVVSGTVGDYIVLFVGGSADDLKLAADVGQSLVATDALAFSDAYASKELAALVYGRKESMETLVAAAGGLQDMTNGLRDGIAGADGLGDTRDLDAMFKIVADREAALRKLMVVDSEGMIAYFEDGLKLESFGGTDYGMVDWKSPNKLARLGDSPDVVLFADMTSDAVYSEKSRAYVEALMETAYAMTMKVADVPMKGDEMAQFTGMAKMIDVKFRPDLVALWDAFSKDFGTGLGKESALVIDLAGSAPAIPGIPQPVVDKAKVPRISMVCSVVDRAKLAGSWDKMSTTLTGTLAKVSEMTGQKIPMQKPISSDKNNNTTWFFPMPFFTDDFLPSVTVGDKWFVASTSKNQALDLITKADAGGETRDGFWFCMNFKALEKYSKETFNLIDENAAAMMGAPLPDEQKVMIKKAISTLDDLDKLTVHTRREGAQIRSSVHFKTR